MADRGVTGVPRLLVTQAQIARVVAVFYAGVRGHSQLGPVFGAHVTDWPSHEEKIVRFWSNALLSHRGYDGNPMAVHRAAGNVKAEHFAVWLAMFDAALKQELPADLAGAWSALAHRIGRGLQYGLEPACGNSGVPKL